MKLLLAAATQVEIEPLINRLGTGRSIPVGNNAITILITGVGMVATAYAMGRELASADYDLAINAGIAGSFDHTISIGEVVLVKEDHLAELGAENDKEFLSIDEMGFGESCLFPGHSDHLEGIAGLSGLKAVKGITVNKVHGNTGSIRTIAQRLDPVIESMEGAAFFYACNRVNLPCIQLRSVSNYVVKRDPRKWNIRLAVENLNNCLTQLLDEL